MDDFIAKMGKGKIENAVGSFGLIYRKAIKSAKIIQEPMFQQMII